MLICPAPRVTLILAALSECWFFQLSSTLTVSAGGGGKGSPSSPGKIQLKHAMQYIYNVRYQNPKVSDRLALVPYKSTKRSEIN